MGQSSLLKKSPYMRKKTSIYYTSTLEMKRESKYGNDVGFINQTAFSSLREDKRCLNETYFPSAC
jgi:hypothetical protein